MPNELSNRQLAERRAQCAQWNADRDSKLNAVGFDYEPVSFHYKAAYEVMVALRDRHWHTHEFKVVKVKLKPWDTEIHARRKAL